jgi:hypothetical protein
MQPYGTGEAQRYFACDFDQLSSRLFDANGIAVVSRRWRPAPLVLHALSQHSNAVLDREKIDEGELHESCQNCFNQLKRKENALVLPHGPFAGPKIDWTDWNYKSD